MKKNLLVTLADKNYLNQAKQLFSSAYFNAGWQGDYMLLSHDIPQADLEWFKNKGILIKQCQPLYREQVGGMVGVLTSKFYLFTSEFKKWNNIIYVDADIIIRSSLDELTQVNGFVAVADSGNSKLSDQFIKSNLVDQKYKALFEQLEEEYDLKSLAFNAGFFAFNTKLIEDDTFNQLNGLLQQYEKIMRKGDQPAFNLFFYRQIEALPPVYNVYITGNSNPWHIKLKKIKGILIHFITSEKPWVSKNYFYQEWKNNLAKANKIDLQNIPVGKQWPKREIINYSNYLKIRYIFFYLLSRVDRGTGRLGIFLKKYLPRLYWALKMLEGKKK